MPNSQPAMNGAWIPKGQGQQVDHVAQCGSCVSTHEQRRVSFHAVLQGNCQAGNGSGGEGWHFHGLSYSPLHVLPGWKTAVGDHFAFRNPIPRMPV